MPMFKSPVQNVKFGRDFELWFVTNPKPKTVVKFQGQWKTVFSPAEDFLAQCEVVLRGGFTHKIEQSLADELSAAGFAEFISED
jgi:hypothetical protein